jgi:hypothetical protein
MLIPMKFLNNFLDIEKIIMNCLFLNERILSIGDDLIHYWRKSIC